MRLLDGAPVAYLVEGSHDGKLYAKIVHFTVDEARNSAAEFARHYSTVTTTPLARSTDGVQAAAAGFVLVPLDAPERLRGQLCGYGADLGYMDPRDRAVIVQRGAERWAEILRWAGAPGVSRPDGETFPRETPMGGKP